MRGLAKCAVVVGTSLLLLTQYAGAAPGGDPGANPDAPGQAGRAAGAPELSRAGAAATATLLIGGAAVLMARARNRSRTA